MTAEPYEPETFFVNLGVNCPNFGADLCVWWFDNKRMDRLKSAL